MTTVPSPRSPAVPLALLAALLWAGAAGAEAAAVAADAGAPHMETETDPRYKLPDGFLFGGGTASYQTEGAWDKDGKTLSVFDHSYHLVNATLHGDTAADSYTHYAEDIALAHELNLDVYRISISWPRVCPDGHCDRNTTKAGVNHYHAVIDEILKYNMTPMITIYHFDHPQALEDEFGGWLDAKMIDVFVTYADFIFKEYGAKVKHWLTLNEINMHCLLTYGGFGFPPGLTMNTTDDMVYKCMHHEILAHSAAYRLYQDRYRAASPGSVVGIGSVTFFSRPNSTEYDDVDAADRANMFDVALVLGPLVHGDYPEVVRRTLLASKGAGYLPEFTDEQKRTLPGTIDFVGLNAYFGATVASPRKGADGGHGGVVASWNKLDANVSVVGRPAGGAGGFGDVFSTLTPWIIRDVTLFIKSHFPAVKIFVTENGIGHKENSIDDWDSRAVYHSAYLRELTRTINEDGANVIGYTVWSFLDDFEWSGGYERRFGIVHVDYEGGSLKRTLKRSKYFFQKLMADRAVPLVEAAASAAMKTASLAVVLTAAVALLRAPVLL